MSKPQAARNQKWITLTEALQLGGVDHETFQRCAVAGDIKWRWRTADGRAKHTSYQNEGKHAWICGAVDWEDSTICLEPGAPKG